MTNEEVFSESFFDTPIWDLQIAVNREMVKLKVNPKNRKRINELLEELSKHNVITYSHSLRVGLLASRLAEMMPGFEQKPLLLAGVLHDYGKVNIENEILEKIDFDKHDHKKVKSHVLEGYNQLVSQFLFSAEIVVRHHQFNGEPYPEVVPVNEKMTENMALKVKFYARLLAFVDFYDAINSRRNDKWGEGKLPAKRRKEIILRENPDLVEMIEAMYKRGLFH